MSKPIAILPSYLLSFKADWLALCEFESADNRALCEVGIGLEDKLEVYAVLIVLPINNLDVL